MPRKLATLSLVFGCALAATAGFVVAFLDPSEARHLVAGAVAVAVSGTLASWNFDSASGRSPTWEQIDAWVGRGLARVSYVALFGIPIAAGLYGAAGTRPPSALLLGYLSSLSFATATTTHILRGRFPRAIDPLARWTGAISITLGFLALLLLFYVQAIDVADAYRQPRRDLSLEPVRRYVETGREHGAEALEEALRLEAEVVATSRAIREAAESLVRQIESVEGASTEVRKAALDLQAVSHRLDALLTELESERKRLEDRFRIFK